MSKPKISVIVPIYNVGTYLEETLNSLVNQTFIDDIEVLMIDDGSTDDSKYIIEKYALDYDNFYAHHKENEGQGVARNLGVYLAKGEYIHFLDADDYVVPNAYEKLFNAASSKNYDFVAVNAMRMSQYNCWEDQLFKNSFGELKGNSEFNNIREHPPLVWDTSTSNKIYKKDFLIKNNIKFPDKKIYYEDLLFSFKAYVHANSFYYLDDFLYFWRRRNEKSSVTQQSKNVINFKNRLEILNSILELIETNDCDDNIKEQMYAKWLNHDLKLFLSKINYYPKESHDELLNEILDILKIIPKEIREGMDSYRKIIYKMVEDKDLKSLLYFAPLEEELIEDSTIKLDLSEEYSSLINFDEDVLKEDLIVKKTDIRREDDFIIIKFEEKIPYLPENHPHRMEASLIDENNGESNLEIKDNELYIPIDLIANKRILKIKMKYSTDSFEKETYLRNYGRSSILLDDVDLEICIGADNLFSIHIREIDNNNILIQKIDFEEDCFIFKGKMNKKIKNIIIENVIDFKVNEYPIFFNEKDVEDKYNFEFKIPYRDIINSPIKKWEMKSADKFKTMQLTENFEFFREKDKILFSNRRNKILIENDLYNKFEKLSELDNKIKETTNEKNKLIKEKNKLNKEKNRLIEENNQLKNKINEYKNRKDVRAVDAIKKTIGR